MRVKTILRRFPTLLSLVPAMACVLGCTTIVDTMTDSAFDETEERKIKADYHRLYNGEPLKYHRSEGDLRRHAVKERFEDAWFEDDDDFNVNFSD